MIRSSRTAGPAFVASAVLTCVVLTGCITGSGGGEAGSGPQAADVLTIALPEDHGPVNIFASHEEPLTELIYDKLLAPSPYVDKPQPWLASAVRSVDPATWEVDIRSGVTWHDGEKFTAKDVVFTFGFFKKAPTGRWTHHVSDIPTIESITTTDPDTVRFRCAFACPELGTVTLADLPIIPEHIWAKVRPAAVKQITALPVGTGPFKLTSYSPTSGYVLKANPSYFGGKPRVGELRMPVIADPSAQFTALRSGQVDATAGQVPPELIGQFSNSKELKLIKTAPFQFPELKLNYEHAPFDNPSFRRAISRSLDRDQLLQTVFLGKGRPAVKGYPHPDAPFANPSLSTPYAPKEATALLDQLGFRDSNGDGVREGPTGPLQYQIYTNGGLPIDVRAAELVAENLRAIGIRATVKGVDAGALADLSMTRKFDLAISTISAHGIADPTQFIMSHRSGYLWKAPKIPYPEWDALFSEWKATTTLADRTAVLQDMQELFNRQPTSIPLCYPDEYWAVRPSRYDGWIESPGYGVVHKWSLLPTDVGRDANAVVAAR